MAQLMPLPLTVSCFSKIQIGFTFLVPAHMGSPRKGLLNGCVCVYIYLHNGYRMVIVVVIVCTILFILYNSNKFIVQHSYRLCCTCVFSVVSNSPRAFCKGLPCCSLAVRRLHCSKLAVTKHIQKFQIHCRIALETSC